MVMGLRSCSSVVVGLLILLASAVARGERDSDTDGLDLDQSPALSGPFSRSGTSVEIEPLLPMGFRHRVRPVDQTRLEWHLRKEAVSALTVSGFYVGAYAAQRLLPDYITKVTPVLLNGAGITLDYLTAQDATDFGFRLGLRSIPFMMNLIINRSPYYIPNPILEALILESPAVIKGLAEYSGQSNLYTTGVNSLLPGSEFDQKYFRIFYSAESEPSIKIQFRETPTKESLQECDLPDGVDGNKAVHSELMKLRCQARKHQINHLELLPFNYQGNWLIATFSKADGSRFGFTIKYPNTPSRLLWLTDPLRLNSAVSGLKPVLSPLSQCILNELGELLSWNLDRDFSENVEIESQCSDLEVSVLSTENLMMFPLGGRGYLLVDHGISQGLSNPLIWLNSVADTQQITQEWLSRLEYDLIPGPERGAWRAVSILRSIVTRTAAQYGISWLIGLRRQVQEQDAGQANTTLQQQPSGENRTPAPAGSSAGTPPMAPSGAAPTASSGVSPTPEAGPISTAEPAPAPVRNLSLLRGDIENRLATDERVREYLEAIPEDRNVILIRGNQAANNRFLRILLRSNEDYAEFVNRNGDGLIRTFDHPETNTLYVELPDIDFDPLRELELGSRQGFDEVLRGWINRAIRFIGIHNNVDTFWGRHDSIIGDITNFRNPEAAALNIVELVNNAPDYLEATADEEYSDNGSLIRILGITDEDYENLPEDLREAVEQGFR
ncbi:hypothetical protein M3P05_10325 [Sansalvadorimonas sp. 2012CJ34-2]|uniref:Uncharacterized protein n=1 Tax=Parendozoicomonas callyspongiae TaxID=2942213 RepID=A0ABT0PG27_9GAMM|nr:hypothetical protein [Sansalvadorimonas sp. 2012CJ34-2]MCL6270315.1 hypothetical protein [Sansalvadorimonas sp. 2012CJ34-2]